MAAELLTMKIFLNNRIIQFTGTSPVNLTEKDFFIVYETQEQLKSCLEKFEGDPLSSRLIIGLDIPGEESLKSCTEKTVTSIKHHPVYQSFLSLFRFVEAAGGRVRNEKDEILFIYRFEHWDLPKGKIHKKDKGSPSLAAIREVMEETGLQTVNILRELTSTWHIYYAKEQRCLKRTYWFEMFAESDQPLTPQTEEDILLVRWISPSDLETILNKAYPSLRELF